MDSFRLLVRHAMHMYDVRPNNTRICRTDRVTEGCKNDCPRFSSAKEASLTRLQSIEWSYGILDQVILTF